MALLAPHPLGTALTIALPLSVVAADLALAWPWWAAVIGTAVAVAVVAHVVSMQAGAMAAMLATSGVALVVERSRPRDLPPNGVELLAMAVLLVVALLFGVDRRLDDGRGRHAKKAGGAR